MIYDHRTYVCRPGTLKAHVALYEKQAVMPVEATHTTMIAYVPLNYGSVLPQTFPTPTTASSPKNNYYLVVY